MSRFPKNHPLYDCPEDVLACLTLASNVNIAAGDAALKARLTQYASNGDREAQVLVEVARMTGQVVQHISRDEQWDCLVVEKRGEAVKRLVDFAIIRKHAKLGEIVGKLYLVGLITISEKGKILIAAARAAA